MMNDCVHAATVFESALFGRVLIQEGLVDWTPDEVRGMVASRSR